MTILIATGLKREARIIAEAALLPAVSMSSFPRRRESISRRGIKRMVQEMDSRLRGNDGNREGVWRDIITVVPGGGDAERLEAELEAAASGTRLILSSGIAGALDPSLKPGDYVIGTGDGIDPVLAQYMHRRLPEAHIGLVTGSDAMAATAAEKQALYAATGALAVDMESHIAARVAARHGIPFGIFRVISDAADDTLPPAARAGMRSDGGMAVGAVLQSLLANPAQLPALIATARHAERAFRALFRCYKVLRLMDFVEHPLDMP